MQFQSPWQCNVISVHPRHHRLGRHEVPASRREQDQDFPRYAEEPNGRPRKAVFGYLSGIVGGSIVDQNQLKVAKCLSLKTLQSFHKQGSAIAYGEQDRNFEDGAGVHEQYLVYLAYGRQSSHALDL